MIKVVLVEDHNIVRDGIKMLLESEAGIHIVGEATNGLEALELLATNEDVDVILSDINMPGMDGLAMIRELKESHPAIKVIILTMLDNEKYVTKAFNEGAVGYLLKNVSSDELIFSLKHVNIGGHYLCSELSITLLKRLTNSPSFTNSELETTVDLSSREIEVLQLIAEGYTNGEISEKMFLSKRTIEGHRQSLIDKTGSRNTAVLVRFAVLHGLIK